MGWRGGMASCLVLALTGCGMGLRETPQVPVEASLSLDAVLGGIGNGSGLFFDPEGVAADPRNGTDVIYVADTGNQRIQYLNHGGDYLKQMGRYGTGPGEFNNPCALALDFGHYLFVSDRDNHRVQQFDVRGVFIRQYPDAFRTRETLRFPSGIALNGFGELYVADKWNDRVVRFDRQGNVLGTLGGFGHGRGLMHRPAAVAVDGDDNLYVADSLNHRSPVLPKLGHQIETQSHFVANVQVVANELGRQAVT